MTSTMSAFATRRLGFECFDSTGEIVDRTAVLQKVRELTGSIGVRQTADDRIEEMDRL